MIQKNLFALLLGTSLLINACQRSQLSLAEANALQAPAVTTASQSAALSVGCDDLESHLWDISYALVLNQDPSENQAAIHPENISKTILKVLGQKQPQDQLSDKTKTDLDFYFQKFFQIHNKILNSNQSTQEKLKALTSAELGKSTDPELKSIQSQLVHWRAQLHKTLQADHLTCGTEPTASETGKTPKEDSPTVGLTVGIPTIPGTPSSNMENQFPDRKNQLPKSPDEAALLPASLSLGAKKTIAVAYQSCHLESLPPLTNTTAAASGVKVLGKSSEGAFIRKIEDLPSFLSTQYYYRDFSLQDQCQDVRKNPMIYDFGGKPNIVTNGKISSIDLFSHGKNTPGVSPEPGLDCSAFVFTAISASGLRLKAKVPLKPILVYAVDSDMYLDPASNGLSCIDKVKMGVSGTLKAGDVIAEPGHVTIIGEVGADPLGVNRITSDADCDKIGSQYFDFVVYQSSAVKHGIGINKFSGKDYIIEDGYFRRGLAEYAKQACHAKFANTDISVHSQNIQVDRFKDSPDCRQTATPLVGEACVSQCY